MCESFDHVPRHSPHRYYQEKGGRVATERDEFDRAAWWRVMVAAVVEPERLIFVEECGTHTSHWHRYRGVGAQGRAIAPFGAPRKRGKNTTRCSRA